MVKEILPDGRNVVDDNGDVMPRHDYSREDYPAPPAEMQATMDVLRSIEGFEESIHFKQLATRGAHDKDVRVAGGITACRRRGLELFLESRATYLHSRGISTLNQPQVGEPDYDNKLDEFDRGVGLWLTFRKSVLEDESGRFATRHALEEKMEQYRRLFH